VSASTQGTNDDLPAALAGLVGEWSGDGVGASSELAADFRFGHELTISRAGPRALAHVSRSWPLDDELAPPDPAAADAADRVMTESGFWRWDPASETVELVLASADGIVSVCYGHIRPDPAGEGAHLELVSDLVGRTATATSVTAEKRLYSRRGDVLLYAVDQAAGDQPLAPRASAALHPVTRGRHSRR
jgi:hypothetical protein